MRSLLCAAALLAASVLCSGCASLNGPCGDGCGTCAQDNCFGGRLPARVLECGFSLDQGLALVEQPAVRRRIVVTAMLQVAQ